VLLVIGWATRFVLVPLIITMLVAVFVAHGGDIFGKGELAFFYLMVYIILLITGAGKYSADNFLIKK
jgi:putative oxidoreductase